MAKLIVAVAIATLLTVPPAVLQGRFTGRWGRSEDLDLAARRIERLPSAFGDWRIETEHEPLSEDVVTELGLANHIGRTYVNRQTGESVRLLLMVGQPGKLVRHPPNICYSNRANTQIGEMKFIDFEAIGAECQFSVLEYRRSSELVGESFAVAYGFTSDGHWASPATPRLEYGGQPLLYKLQALCVGNAFENEQSVKTINKFLQDFVVAFGSVIQISEGTTDAVTS